MAWARCAGLLLIVSFTLAACAVPAAKPPRVVDATPVPVAEAPKPAPKAEESAPAKPQREPPAPSQVKPPPMKSEPATVGVDQRYGDGWQPISLMASHAPAGPTEVRLVFSRPVRRSEVERSLLENQPGPVRGLMQWQDDRTLVWQIPLLPPRLDFLLNGAADTDGTPLPGGIPSLRVGDPPVLVEVDLGNRVDNVRAQVPPDLVTAFVTPDGKQVNLLSWVPGVSPWDWQTRDFVLTLADGSIQPGRVEGAQPRVPDDLENWVRSPNGSMLAGLHTEHRNPPTASPVRADLIISDLRGGRRVVHENFVSRYMGNSHIDLTTHMAWSADGGHIAALDYSDPERTTSALVAVNLSTGTKTTLAPALPLHPSGTRLAWAPGGQFMLAGNLLVNLQTGSYLALEGGQRTARGVWESGGTRLLYAARDWGPVFIVNATSGEIVPLGSGLIVDWMSPERVYVVRWSASGTRFEPPGM